MARKRRKSDMEIFLDLISRLSWKVNLILAIAVYFLLHYLATRPVASPTAVGTIGTFYVKSFIQTMALFGQYILPFLFVIAALTSYLLNKDKKSER